MAPVALNTFPPKIPELFSPPAVPPKNTPALKLPNRYCNGLVFVNIICTENTQIGVFRANVGMFMGVCCPLPPFFPNRMDGRLLKEEPTKPGIRKVLACEAERAESLRSVHKLTNPVLSAVTALSALSHMDNGPAAFKSITSNFRSADCSPPEPSTRHQ